MKRCISPLPETVLALVLAAIVLVPSVGRAEAPYNLAWSRQIGTSADDSSVSVAVDGLGNAFISGVTNGSLGGTNAGLEDAFLTKYDSAGNLAWSRQIGTSGGDRSHSVALDGLGNVFISGFTFGNLGGTNAGNTDAFLTKYDSAGNLVWSRQIGTSGFDSSSSVAVDGLGNAFISGYTNGSLGGTNAGSYDAFLTKYDSAGNLAWSRQIGTSARDESYSVAVDGLGNAFISGGTTGSLAGTNAGNFDAFLTKYNSAGNLLWSRQIGTSETDLSVSVAVDGLGNAFISGYTFGSLGGTNAGSNAGSEDAFLTKYNSAGNLLWSRQIGTSARDLSSSVAVDGLGNAFISGFTRGSLGGTNAGSEDAFLTKYDSAGNLLWSRQIGTSATDQSAEVAVDGLGNAFISGYTFGSLGGTNAGNRDAFLVKFAPVPVPEPSSIVLLGIAGVALAGVRVRRRR